MTEPFIITASLTGLTRLFFILLVAYAVYVLFFRVIIPKALHRSFSNFQKNFSQQNSAHEERNIKKEGEVSIEFVDKQKESPPLPSDAEYVDFEEIKENNNP